MRIDLTLGAPRDPTLSTPSTPSTPADASAADSAAGVAAAAPATPPVASEAAKKTLHQQKEAAQKFEAIFLRQMLSGLEKTNKMGGSGGSKGGASGGGIYGSMMVNSLADTISQQGGVGLADVILKALQGPHVQGAPKK